MSQRSRERLILQARFEPSSGAVDEYRAAHAISLANDNGKASTEDLRQAMVHYRSLFERMVEVEDRIPSQEVQR